MITPQKIWMNGMVQNGCHADEADICYPADLQHLTTPSLHASSWSFGRRTSGLDKPPTVCVGGRSSDLY